MTTLSRQTVSRGITMPCKTVKTFYIMEVMQVRFTAKPNPESC